MTALENVEFPLVFKKVPRRKRRKMSRDMLIKVGLKARLKHRPKEMSGGQQQRVGIARAFVAKPEIVFADEPTGNLDTKTTMEVMDLIKSIARENQQTIVMVTHDPRLAAFADKIIHILDGKIQNVEIVEHPKEVAQVEAVSAAETVAETASAAENKETASEEQKVEEKENKELVEQKQETITEKPTITQDIVVEQQQTSTEKEVIAEQKQTSTEKDDKKETKKDPAQKVEHKRQHKRKSD